jgi:hypothetical protein
MLRNAMQLLHERKRIIQVLQNMTAEEFVYGVSGKRQLLVSARIEVGRHIHAGQPARIQIDPTGANVAATPQMQPPLILLSCRVSAGSSEPASYK